MDCVSLSNSISPLSVSNGGLEGSSSMLSRAWALVTGSVDTSSNTVLQREHICIDSKALYGIMVIYLTP